jgi:hypothetical protein
VCVKHVKHLVIQFLSGIELIISGNVRSNSERKNCGKFVHIED